MGRKRKNKDKNNIIGIIVLTLICAFFLKTTVFKDFNFNDINIKLDNPFKKETIEVTKRSVAEEANPQTAIKEEQINVGVFFTKVTSSKDVYVSVLREKPKTFKGSDVEYSVISLLKGPSKYEKTQGVYSEIPSTTKLISYKETPSRININLSDDFEYGGGGDSLYKRVYQLIKTVNHNTRKPVYLYINGKKASVIGGEGLMLKQPLRSNSLDE